jgi:hypothetical protein
VAEEWVTKKDLAEAIRDSQTEVLRAFYNWRRTDPPLLL